MSAHHGQGKGSANATGPLREPLKSGGQHAAFAVIISPTYVV